MTPDCVNCPSQIFRRNVVCFFFWGRQLRRSSRHLFFFLKCCFQWSNSSRFSPILWHSKLLTDVELHFVHHQLLRRNSCHLFFFRFCSKWSNSLCLFCVSSFHAPCQGELFVQCCWSTWATGNQFRWGIVVCCWPSYVYMWHVNKCASFTTKFAHAAAVREISTFHVFIFFLFQRNPPIFKFDW